MAETEALTTLIDGFMLLTLGAALATVAIPMIFILAGLIVIGRRWYTFRRESGEDRY